MSLPLRLLCMLILVLTMAACRPHASMDPALPLKYELSKRDDIQGQKFHVLLRSLDSRAICFPVEQWPASYGGLDTGGQRAWIVIGERSFPAKNDDFGLCPGGCGFIQVNPGDSLSGAIGYDQFPEAGANLKRLDKMLKYEIFPISCRSEMKVVPPR